MKYYIIAGEASGDLHGSNLMKSIKMQDPQAEFRCWGGDLMEKESGFVVKHIRDLAFMGFLEVFLNLRTILKNMRFCKKDILSFAPDCIIFIDYPGFNLPIAEFTHKKGFKNLYYISPQVWAWKKGRVKKMKKTLDKLYVILPFEKVFFAKQGMSVDFVGHPLLDAIESYRENIPNQPEIHISEKKIIALLPGSRKQEISSMLPKMLSLVKKYPEYEFVVAGLSTHAPSFYEALIANSEATLVFDSTYSLLSKAWAALVTSGTATLETALFSVPEIVCYEGNPISYHIAKRLIKDIHYISLVNLIMDEEIVKELIQSELNEKNLSDEFEKITQEGDYRNWMLQKYEILKEKLGNKGASENAAKAMIRYLLQKEIN